MILVVACDAALLLVRELLVTVCCFCALKDDHEDEGEAGNADGEGEESGGEAVMF